MPAVRVSAQKKRKIADENRQFQKEWKDFSFFVQVRTMLYA